MRSQLAGPAVACLLVLAACTGGDDDADEAEPTPVESETAIECDYPEVDADTVEVVEAETPPDEAAWEGTVEATMQTSQGEIGLEMDADNAPCTINALASLIDQGYYDDTSCHQLVNENAFFLQCGDPTGTGSGNPPWTFSDEVDGEETYEPGTVAMASGGADLNGSQFFIVYEDSPFPPEYTVVGSVDAAGLDIVRDVAEGGVQPAAVGAEITPPAIGLTIESISLDTDTD